MNSKKKELLGTIIEIKLKSSYSHLYDLCFDELKRIEDTYSRFISTSELSKLNKKLHSWQKVSQEMLYLILKSQSIKEKTGTFDITLKKTLDNLGYNNKYSFKEKKSDETFISKLIDYMHPSIKIDLLNKKVFLRKQIEFGGLGKGFALDEVSKVLKKNGCFHYYINAGGDIKTRSLKDPWEILLEHPDDFSKALGKVKLTSGAIASSSGNRRKWGTLHHLLNTKTKKPEMSMKSVFVLADKAVEADAYATALFAAGFTKALELCKKLKIKTLLVSSTNKMFVHHFPVELYKE